MRLEVTKFLIGLKFFRVNFLAEDNPNLNDNILQLKIEYPYYISPTCMDLMQKMLVFEERCRLKIDQVSINLKAKP
jgi:hypothetical protein